MPLFQRTAIGLDISDHSIEAVFIVRKGERPYLASYGRTTLPTGLVVDGFVERRNDLATIIRKLLADQMTPPIPSGVRRVVFGLSDSQVYSHIFEVPRLADEVELAKSLVIESDGYFPYNHSEMFATQTTINLRPDKKDVFYTATHKETLKGFLALFTASGLEPVAIEPESAAIARSVLLPGEPDPALFVDIGARVTNLTIFDRNGTQLSESLSTAGDSFTAALSRASAISIEDAESLKRNQGISADMDQKAQRALSAELERLVTDIRDAVSYYEGRSKRLLKRIVVCGGSVQMPGLMEYLANKLPTTERTFHVEIADPWLGIEVDPALEKLGVKTRGTLITTALGLGLRGAGFQKFSEINFLDPARLELGSHGRSSFQAPSGAPYAAAASASARTFPAFKKPLPHLLKIGLAVVAVLAAAAAVWFAAFYLVPKLKNRGAASAVKQDVSEAPAITPIEAKATLGEDFSAEQSVLTARPVEVEQEVEKLVKHEGAAVSGTAKGRVRLMNNSRTGQTLIARTRLLSETGVQFRLDERVFVPPNGGTVAANVTADVTGADGDVAPGRFSIPGLSVAQQAQIYGESDEPMIGGVTYTGSPVTAEELDKIKSEMVDGIKAAMLVQATEQAPAETHVIAELFGVTSVETVSGPEIGKPSADYTLKIKVTAKILTVSKKEVQQLLAVKAAEGAELSEIKVSASAVDLIKETADIVLSATAMTN